MVDKEWTATYPYCFGLKYKNDNMKAVCKRCGFNRACKVKAIKNKVIENDKAEDK